MTLGQIFLSISVQLKIVLEWKKKKNYICKKKFAKLLFFFFLNKTCKSSIWLQNSIISKFFKNLCLYYIHLGDVMPKKLFIISVANMASGGMAPPDTILTKYYKCHPQSEVGAVVCIMCGNFYHTNEIVSKYN